jgi:MOSC domain-containing protein YiiM
VLSVGVFCYVLTNGRLRITAAIDIAVRVAIDVTVGRTISVAVAAAAGKSKHRKNSGKKEN